MPLIVRAMASSLKKRHSVMGEGALRGEAGRRQGDEHAVTHEPVEADGDALR